MQNFGIKEVKRDDNELVVIATLIDNIPNFGHFTRTCEVMGATALIIPNKRLLLNKVYKRITVTAEKWLTIIEV